MTTTVYHKNQRTNDGIHIPYSFEYADQITREEAAGFIEPDLCKLALQKDDNTLWMLINYNPAEWELVSFPKISQDKLNGIQNGAEINQNAFAIFNVDGNTIQAGTNTDELILNSGNNISLTASPTEKSIVIGVTNHAASHITNGADPIPCASLEADGLMSAGDKIQLDALQISVGNTSLNFAPTQSEIRISDARFAVDYNTDQFLLTLTNPNTTGCGLKISVPAQQRALEIQSGDAKIYGDVIITGRLEKGSGAFVIDHPLDPKNQVLRHSFVESPDMLNIYSGIIQLNGIGQAVVELPSYFCALNDVIHARYQLTAIGMSMPNLHIAAEIQDNIFQIAGGIPNAKVSWTILANRNDLYAKRYPILVEEEKKDKSYLHPELY